jgi:hypothetical protein
MKHHLMGGAAAMAETSAPSGKILISKKVLYSIILIAIIAAAVAVWTFYSKGQISQVEITRFSKLEAEDQHNGYVYWPFEVTIKNVGSNSVSGLTLVIRIFGNDDSQIGSLIEQFSTLGSGEGRTVTTGMHLAYGTGLGLTPFHYLATLKIGDNVLDESTLP